MNGGSGSEVPGHDDHALNCRTCGGEAGIRTLGTGFSPYNGLANRRLQPLGHLTADCKHMSHWNLGRAWSWQIRVTVF
jgi:hypothetical protein